MFPPAASDFKQVQRQKAGKPNVAVFLEGSVVSAYNYEEVLGKICWTTCAMLTK